MRISTFLQHAVVLWLLALLSVKRNIWFYCYNVLSILYATLGELISWTKEQGKKCFNERKKYIENCCNSVFAHKKLSYREDQGNIQVIGRTSLFLALVLTML